MVLVGRHNKNGTPVEREAIVALRGVCVHLVRATIDTA
jgi:hypothetical protein